MKITYTRDPLHTSNADLLAVSILAPTKTDEKKIAALSKTDGGVELDKALDGLLTTICTGEELTGDVGAVRIIPTAGKIAARYVALVGAGDPKKVTLDTLRRVGAALARAAEQVKARSIAGTMQPENVRDLRPAQRAKALAEGLVLGTYRFDQYKAKSERTPRTLASVTLVVTRDRASVEAAVETGMRIAEAQNFARDLVNQPGNICTPQYLAEHARRIAKHGKLECTIFDHKQIIAQRMHLINAVTQGSANPPTFIHLRYTPTKKPKAHIALIGKGVTFDTGGVDLKPSKHMEHMKNDMAGAASVLATMQVIAAEKPALLIDAFCPCTENVIDGKAHRPGDIVTSRSGKTIELLNLDAEGRLILADALDYACEKKPDLMIDVATLTGGVLYAVGEIYSAVVGNDQPLIDRVLAASKTAGDPMWQLPLEQEYKKGFKSGPAELRNIGKTSASTISGALFLEEFVGGNRWAHLDIAASSWTDDDRPYTPKGGTGAPVRTFCELLLNY